VITDKMEAVSAKRRDVEYNLSQDETKVKELHESLNQSQKLTTSMVAILESFQNRLNKLDKNIMPVYQKTKQLTQLQENVDQTLNKLEHVIGYHHIADEVEPKLRGGPAGDIEGYLKLLDKLRVAVDFFKYNNPSSDELSHVNSCFDQGIEMLEKEFSQLLRNHSSPVQFSALQKLMEDSKEGGAKPTIQHLPDDIVKDLATICRYVVTVAGGEGRTDILASYTQIRSKILGRTLNSFTESTSVSRKQAFTPFSSTPTKKQSGRKKETSTSSSIRNKIMVPTKLSGNFIAGEVVNEIDEQLEGSSSIIKLSTILVKLMKVLKGERERGGEKE
jgi:exocyst complex protein 7